MNYCKYQASDKFKLLKTKVSIRLDIKMRQHFMFLKCVT